MDTHTTTVDVATAAARLGITPEAVYKRIRRGQLPANRLDGRWFVQLDGLNRRNGRADQPAEPPDEPPSPGSSSASTAPLVAVLEATVAAQQAEIERLHERLREAHVLAAQLAQRPALPAPRDTELTRNDSAETPRPWWAALLWWRR